MWKWCCCFRNYSLLSPSTVESGLDLFDSGFGALYLLQWTGVTYDKYLNNWWERLSRLLVDDWVTDKGGGRSIQIGLCLSPKKGATLPSLLNIVRRMSSKSASLKKQSLLL